MSFISRKCNKIVIKIDSNDLSVGIQTQKISPSRFISNEIRIDHKIYLGHSFH